jgi:hypothetical protein
VLAVGGQRDLAREELGRCMAQLDERGLRHLPAGTLSDLLVVGETLGVEIPDANLRRLAAELLPPSMRKKP